MITKSELTVCTDNIRRAVEIFFDYYDNLDAKYYDKMRFMAKTAAPGGAYESDRWINVSKGHENPAWTYELKIVIEENKIYICISEKF